MITLNLLTLVQNVHLGRFRISYFCSWFFIHILDFHERRNLMINNPSFSHVRVLIVAGDGPLKDCLCLPMN